MYAGDDGKDKKTKTLASIAVKSRARRRVGSVGPSEDAQMTDLVCPAVSPVQTDHSDNIEETTMEVNINDIAKRIACGAEHRIMRATDNVPLSRRAPIGIMPYTGAAVKLMSNITRWDRRLFVDCKQAFADAQAEIEADEDGVPDNSKEVKGGD